MLMPFKLPHESNYFFEFRKLVVKICCLILIQPSVIEPTSGLFCHSLIKSMCSIFFGVNRSNENLFSSRKYFILSDITFYWFKNASPIV